MADKNYKDMKKYKLIKWYPSLKKIREGSEVIWEEDTEEYYHPPTISALEKEEVENNPEFWEEVGEKEFEILQMKNSHGNFYSLFKNEELSSYEKENHTIHSVKRLSDGEVFTVGDEAITEHGSYGNITEFELKYNKIYITTKAGKNRCYLDDLKPIKQPLLTTIDGVNIFEGDIYWWVTEDNEICGGAATKYSGLPENKEFSTKEAAEEYTLMNKPCLSINDCLELNDKMGTNPCGRHLLSENLKELVESKLK